MGIGSEPKKAEQRPQKDVLFSLRQTRRKDHSGGGLKSSRVNQTQGRKGRASVRTARPPLKLPQSFPERRDPQKAELGRSLEFYPPAHRECLTPPAPP